MKNGLKYLIRVLVLIALMILFTMVHWAYFIDSFYILYAVVIRFGLSFLVCFLLDYANERSLDRAIELQCLNLLITILIITVSISF
ncbi:MAG: putative membrane protein [Flavobacteriales bacterium]|jgi:uncharacterized membrane protein